MDDLGFKRRGHIILGRIREAIAEARRDRPQRR
jgi:hypothetical protein